VSGYKLHLPHQIDQVVANCPFSMNQGPLGADTNVPMATKAYTYKAFISYSHATDGRVAPALQHALHGFARPWYRLRAIRLFRDTTNLAANPHLWSSIESALEQSEYLLLLASPEAARSKWVPRELDTFLRRRTPEKTLLVLTDGELAWDSSTGDFDWGRTTSFPRLQRKIFDDEPLYVDLRRARSKEELDVHNPDFKSGVAKLSSAMRGIPLDEIIGQDVQEHKKTMRLAWSGVTLLFMLTVAAVFFGLSARKEARDAEAGRLAAQADLVRRESATSLEQSALLAVESMHLVPSLAGDSALRAASSLLARPVWSAQFRDRVSVVAYSADGRYLAAGGGYNTLRIFAASGGTEVSKLTFKSQCLAFSPDGRYVAGSSGSTVYVFDRASGKKVWKVTVTEYDARVAGQVTDQVGGVAFSPDGRYVASVSGHTVRVFQAGSGKEVSRLTFEYGVAAAVVAFSRDGHYVAAGSSGGSGTARVFEAANGREVSQLAFSDDVNAVAFSPDGHYVAAGSADKTVRVFNAITGKEVSRLTFQGSVTAASFNSDGRYVVAGSSDSTAKVFETLSGQQVSLLAFQYGVNAVAFGPDGRYVAAGSDDYTARVFDAASGREVSRLTFQDKVRSVAFSPDGHQIAAGSDDKTLKVSEAVGRSVSRYTVQDRVVRAAISTDGRYVAIGSADNMARGTVVATGQELLRATFGGEVDAVAFSVDGRYMAAGSEDGAARVFDLTTGKQISTRVLQDPDEARFPVVSLAFSPDGASLAAGMWDGTARVFAVRDGKQLTQLVVQDPKEEARFAVGAVAFSPDGRYVVTGAQDGTARVFETTNAREVSRLTIQGNNVVAVVFSPYGDYVAAGGSSSGQDGTARVFLAASGKELARLTFQGEVNSVAFSRDGRHVAAGSDDRTARVFETLSGKEVSRLIFQGSVYAVAFSADDALLTSVSTDGRDLLVIRDQLSSQDMINEACSRLTRNLTIGEWKQFMPGEKYRKTCPNLPSGAQKQTTVAPPST
jgi:WD40 repeat protein